MHTYIYASRKICTFPSYKLRNLMTLNFFLSSHVHTHILWLPECVGFCKPPTAYAMPNGITLTSLTYD